MLVLTPSRSHVFHVFDRAFFVQRRTLVNKRLYEDAIVALNSLQSNHAINEAIGASSRKFYDKAISEMIEWCGQSGFTPSDLSRLNAIHIAGTKGKGSTSAFVASILQQYIEENDGGTNPKLTRRLSAPTKGGLYTSPHLRSVRERIQVNGLPLSEQEFAREFFTVWDRLETRGAHLPMIEEGRTKPGYFRFLTLMAFSNYLAQGVDAAVIECGIGGEYDSTNVLLRPRVTGITSLGIDHTALLGSSIGQIAWHKAGIMKSDVPAFTVRQPEQALEVLDSRAKERNTQLKIVDVHPGIASGEIRLSLAGDFQKGNASLAVELAAAYLRAMGHEVDTRTLNDKFIRGLTDVRWSGRGETREETKNGITWYIDGAHTLESIEAASTWFAECARKAEVEISKDGRRVIRILLFNQQTRSGAPLLQRLQEVISEKLDKSELFDHAIFTTNITFDKTGFKPELTFVNPDNSKSNDVGVQKMNAQTWKTLDDSSHVHVSQNIEQSINLIRQISAASGGRDRCKTQVFNVGSTHLIGGVLEVLETLDS